MKPEEIELKAGYKDYNPSFGWSHSRTLLNYRHKDCVLAYFVSHYYAVLIVQTKRKTMAYQLMLGQKGKTYYEMKMFDAIKQIEELKDKIPEHQQLSEEIAQDIISKEIASRV